MKAPCILVLPLHDGSFRFASQLYCKGTYAPVMKPCKQQAGAVSQGLANPQTLPTEPKPYTQSPKP